MQHEPHKVLIFTVSYGQGHNAAAQSLAEEYEFRGWETSVVDPCEQASSVIFPLTQAFYRFCVRRAPWLWGVVYAQTETANWAHAVHQWPLSVVARRVEQLLREQQPDLVICTYPLYAYMLDELKKTGKFHGRYAVMVTDSLAISRPWMLSEAPLVCVIDEYSSRLVKEAYGLPDTKLCTTGFPVRRAFVPSSPIPPSETQLRVVYGAYRSTFDVKQDVKALLCSFPDIQMTLLAGKRAALFERAFAPLILSGHVRVLATTGQMAELFADSHFYIGKGGAATLFECYAAQLPVLVNFALPGQEQGNLELLQRDGTGCAVCSTAELISTLRLLLADGAFGWQRLRTRMRNIGRARGAAAVADAVERTLFS